MGQGDARKMLLQGPLAKIAHCAGFPQSGEMGDMDTLILACGNIIRGDDQVGWRVADALERKSLPGVEVRRVHQLTPELVEALLQVERTVIVDAGVGKRSSFRRVKGRAGTALTHHLTAETLVGLAERLYGSVREVYLCTVAGDSFDLSEKMSAAAESRVRRAARRLILFLESSHA
jgi:hydrogenase maturation protease